MKYAYIGECSAGWIKCFGHKWECGIPYDIGVEAVIPGSKTKKNPKGVLVLSKLDGNPEFTKDMEKISFLAAAREERVAREKILAEKRLTFAPEEKRKVESILVEPQKVAEEQLDSDPTGRVVDKTPLFKPAVPDDKAEVSLDEILGIN